MKKNNANHTGTRLLCLLLCLCMAVGTVLLSGCAPAHNNTDPASDGVVRIICTTYPACEFARVLCEGLTQAGVSAEAEMLSSKGQDIHSFQPTAADIRKLAEADVFLCIGGTGEAWVEKAVQSAKNDSLTVISMMNICPAMEEIIPEGAEPEEDEDATEVEYDEHIWTSFGNAERIVNALAGAVESKLTGQEQAVTALHTAQTELVNQLNTLKSAYTETIASAARRSVVIADRYPFAYLFTELGIKAYAAFPGCSAETQAGFETQIFLIEKTRELGLSAVFTVDNGAGSVAETISRETGVQVLRLFSGQTIPDGGMTYLEMLEENLKNLRIALN